MLAFERMVATDGYEVMLFPLPYIYITQGENGSYSHQGILAIDFVGWGANGRIYEAPMYAPCSCRCVATIDASTIPSEVNPYSSPLDKIWEIEFAK